MAHIEVTQDIIDAVDKSRGERIDRAKKRGLHRDLQRLMVEISVRDQEISGWLSQYGAGCVLEFFRDRGYDV